MPFKVIARLTAYRMQVVGVGPEREQSQTRLQVISSHAWVQLLKHTLHCKSTSISDLSADTVSVRESWELSWIQTGVRNKFSGIPSNILIARLRLYSRLSEWVRRYKPCKLYVTSKTVKRKLIEENWSSTINGTNTGITLQTVKKS